MAENKKKLLGVLDEVLLFSFELIVFELEGKAPEDSRVKQIRELCQELADAGVYQFQTNCDDEKLFEQIHTFAQNEG